MANAPPPETPFSLKPVYVLIFSLLFVGGLLFASMSLQLTRDMGFCDALTKVVRRIFRCVVSCRPCGHTAGSAVARASPAPASVVALPT
jgi:hypothetical protein